MLILKDQISVDRKEFYNDRNRTAIDNFLKQNPTYLLKKNLLGNNIGSK